MLDMGPEIWVLDLLVIAHPANPYPPTSPPPPPSQEANSSGQNYNLDMLLANCFLCNQQASSTVNQIFQPFSPESIDSQDTQIIKTRKGL